MKLLLISDYVIVMNKKRCTKFNFNIIVLLKFDLKQNLTTYDVIFSEKFRSRKKLNFYFRPVIKNHQSTLNVFQR